MSYSENNGLTYSHQEVYSRSNRRRQKQKVEQIIVATDKMPFVNHFVMLLCSILIGLTSVAVPFFSDFVTSEQSQNLMAGFALSYHHLPYSSIQVSGGFLYYTLLALAYHFKNIMLTIPFFVLALYISGLYLYKICYSITKQTPFATRVYLFFYLANFALAFGGLYPAQFGLPFLLSGIWCLVKYFKDKCKDERFILYGLVIAISILFEPNYLIFSLVSFVVLVVFNLFHKRIARGIYQFLCFLFGALVVGYSVGYFLFNLQILSVYLDRTILKLFAQSVVGNEELWKSALVQFVIIFATGVLFAFVLGLQRIFLTYLRPLRIIMVISLLVYLVKLFFVRDLQFYHILLLLPFSLVLIALNLSFSETDDDFDYFFFSGFKSLVYPLSILCLFSVFQIIALYLGDRPYQEERKTVSNYLQNHLSRKDKIYAWDNVSTIYVLSKASSNTPLSNPVVFATSKNQKQLDSDLMIKKHDYIIVNNSLSVTPKVQKLLSSKYELVSVKELSYFKIYHLK